MTPARTGTAEQRPGQQRLQRRFDSCYATSAQIRVGQGEGARRTQGEPLVTESRGTQVAFSLARYKPSLELQCRLITQKTECKAHRSLDGWQPCLLYSIVMMARVLCVQTLA